LIGTARQFKPNPENWVNHQVSPGGPSSAANRFHRWNPKRPSNNISRLAALNVRQAVFGKFPEPRIRRDSSIIIQVQTIHKAIKHHTHN